MANPLTDEGYWSEDEKGPYYTPPGGPINLSGTYTGGYADEGTANPLTTGISPRPARFRRTVPAAVGDGGDPTSPPPSPRAMAAYDDWRRSALAQHLLGMMTPSAPSQGPGQILAHPQGVNPGAVYASASPQAHPMDNVLRAMALSGTTDHFLGPDFQQQIDNAMAKVPPQRVADAHEKAQTIAASLGHDLPEHWWPTLLAHMSQMHGVDTPKDWSGPSAKLVDELRKDPDIAALQHDVHEHVIPVAQTLEDGARSFNEMLPKVPPMAMTPRPNRPGMASAIVEHPFVGKGWMDRAMEEQKRGAEAFERGGTRGFVSSIVEPGGLERMMDLSGGFGGTTIGRPGGALTWRGPEPSSLGGSRSSHVFYHAGAGGEHAGTIGDFSQSPHSSETPFSAAPTHGETRSFPTLDEARAYIEAEHARRTGTPLSTMDELEAEMRRLLAKPAEPPHVTPEQARRWAGPEPEYDPRWSAEEKEDVARQTGGVRYEPLEGGSAAFLGDRRIAEITDFGHHSEWPDDARGRYRVESMTGGKVDFDTMEDARAQVGNLAAAHEALRPPGGLEPPAVEPARAQAWLQKPAVPALPAHLRELMARVERAFPDAPGSVANYWDKHISHIDPEEFKRGMFPIDAPGARHAMDAHGDRSNWGVTWPVTVKSGGMYPAIMGRDFNHSTGMAHHGYFEMPRDATGGGIGRKVYASQVDLYHKMGMKGIDMTANIDVGGYAWAKYGFEPHGGYGLDRMRRYSADRLGDVASQLTEPELDMVHHIIGSLDSNPKAVWALSDLDIPVRSYLSDHVPLKQQIEPGVIKLGQHLLLNTSWPAKMMFNDERAMSRFNTYVGRKPKAK